MKSTRSDQTTFFDMATSQRETSNKVLETITELIDFSEAERKLEETYSTRGRPGHRVSVMLRIMILQHLYGLSDPQAEVQLNDRLSFQRFVGVQPEERIPDETTICRFRRRLIKCGLHEELLELLNKQLEARGLILKCTTLIDASLLQSSRKRPTPEAVKEGQVPDADASFTRKNFNTYYGYKAHISADGEHHLIRRAKISTAREQDCHWFEPLAPEDSGIIYADKAYDTKANKNWMEQRGIENAILKKGAHHIKLTPEDQQRNKELGETRQQVERIFGHLKQWQGYRRVRYMGLAKNQLELTLKATAYNLKRLAALAT